MIKATYTDKKLVVDILVSAFETFKEDNSINLTVKQDKKRTYRMRVLMGYLFEKAMLFGEVLLSNDKKGCVLVKYSKKEKITLKTILLDIKLVFKCIGIERIYKIIKRQNIAKRHYPKEDHIKPIIIGVKKELKGKISTARFITTVINHYSENKLPVIIDTVSSYNVKLYQKIGFKIIKKEDSVGFPIYFMRIN